MTEAEWLRSNQVRVMAGQLDVCRFDRKLRLFAAACCRAAWSKLAPEFRSVIDASESYADGQVSLGVLRDLYYVALECDFSPEQDAVQSAAAMNCASWWASANLYLASAHRLAEVLVDPGERERGAVHVRWRVERNLRIFADFLRDIVGNPFHPIAFESRWRTADATALARTIYEDRVFDRMPLLADALMDAGCADEQIIGHCRGAGPHVRGCWVVDLVLGKE
jgi:hypothetical protein